MEMIHTATLVHDDVVDDSTIRRGFFSINALWKNKIAVLVGDYLLSKSLQLSADNDDFDFLKILFTDQLFNQFRQNWIMATDHYVEIGL